MLNKLLSSYSLYFPEAVTYMLQASEYDIDQYLNWLRRAGNFNKVAERRTLEPTQKARVLLVAVRVLFFVPIVLAGIFFVLWVAGLGNGLLLAAILLFLNAPVLAAFGIVGPLKVGERYIQKPQEQKMIASAREKLMQTSAFKIAIAGSYGKTTMREILHKVLSDGRRVAAAPGNYNTPLGVYRFVQTLDGNEEILIFEFGEYYPGDVQELCEMVEPQIGIITGVNSSHLSKFKTLQKTTDTIFELANYLFGRPVYKNIDNEHVAGRVRLVGGDDPYLYGAAGAGGWGISNVEVSLSGTSFVAQKGNRIIQASTPMLGRHIVGSFAVAIAIAESAGLSDEQIRRGIASTMPIEHRMSPRGISGATIIDDTYNGNIDGVRAGVAFMSEIEVGGRRIYVTPGLVEQGDQTAEVHHAIGELIAPVFDVVVLMKNSTTSYITHGLRQGGFKGELVVVDKPLEFYQNLELFVAAGDVVLMQNDWTDNYS